MSKTAMQNSSKSLQNMKANDILGMLKKFEPQMKNALPKHISPERVYQITFDVALKNPKILECSPSSLVGAMLQAASLGFKPIPTLGYCYFVPYGGNVQFQIGYKGYIELAKRSGRVADIYGHCVYEDDKFEYELGLERKLIHEPNLNADRDFDKIKYAYSVAKLKDGTKTFIVLDKKQIEALRLRSPMQSPKKLNGAWSTDYDKMAIAKAIKQLSKFLPLDTDIRESLASDEQVIDIEHLKDGKYLSENAEQPEEENEINYETGEVKNEKVDEEMTEEEKALFED